MSPGYVKINRRILQPLMSQQQLDRAQVRSGLQHVRSETVPQRVRANALTKPGAERCFVAGIPHDLIGERTLWLNRFNPAGEEIRTRLVLAPSPILSQSFKQLRRERQIAVTRAFPLMHMNQHQRAIYVGDLQVHGFGSPQSGCIQQHQQGAVSQVQTASMSWTTSSWLSTTGSFLGA